ncbi:MAG: hypothetical protein AAF191_00230 [Verrucomicrobiota bacterium]
MKLWETILEGVINLIFHNAGISKLQKESGPYLQRRIGHFQRMAEAAAATYPEKHLAFSSWNPEVEIFSGDLFGGYVAWDDIQTVVAFRGTQNGQDRSTILQWICNLGATPAALPGGRGFVHSSYLAELDSMYDSIREILAKHHRTDRSLWIVGHSAGGALATLAAERMCYDNTLMTRFNRPNEAFSFSGPLVGDANFAKSYPIRVSNFAVGCDVVPLWPPPVSLRNLVPQKGTSFIKAVEKIFVQYFELPNGPDVANLLASDIEFCRIGQTYYRGSRATKRAAAPLLLSESPLEMAGRNLGMEEGKIREAAKWISKHSPSTLASHPIRAGGGPLLDVIHYQAVGKAITDQLDGQGFSTQEGLPQFLVDHEIEDFSRALHEVSLLAPSSAP